MCRSAPPVASSQVLVIGATNRMSSLDDALLRPGRFDRSIYMGKPTRSNRLKILQVMSASLERGVAYWLPTARPLLSTRGVLRMSEASGLGRGRFVGGYEQGRHGGRSSVENDDGLQGGESTGPPPGAS